MRSWSAQNLPTDPPPQSQQKSLSSWYAQGLTDEIGDRLLMFDNTDGPSLELLRFRPQLIALPGFENALRERVELLGQFRHASFARVRAVEHLSPINGLTLVSTYVAGKRLSEVLPKLKGPFFALWLIHQIVPALASLQEQGGGIAHGGLVADRIIMTPEGQLVMVEHVLGSALARLQLSPGQLWTRFGIAAIPSSGTFARLDRQTDVLQVGLIAFSLLLGRAIGADEYPYRLRELFDRFTQSAGAELSPSLQVWLARALQLSSHPFGSARDAANALGELTLDGAHTHQDTTRLVADTLVATSPRIEAAEPAATNVSKTSGDRVRSHEDGWPREGDASRAGALTAQPGGSPSSRLHESDVPDRTPHDGASSGLTRLDLNTPVEEDDENEIEMSLPVIHDWIRPARWLTATLALVAVAQAVLIGYLLYFRTPTPSPAQGTVVIESPEPGARVFVDDQPVGVTPFQLRVGSATRSVRIIGAEIDKSLGAGPTARTQDVDSTTGVGRASGPVQPDTPIRAGGIRLISPIELQLLDGNRMLGSSTDGALVAAAGRREFELVNSSLGYRVRQIIDIKPGQVISLPVSRPNGHLSINAVPWADVWIDGTRIGETPLANLPIPIGEHEVVFRHPTFGEQRRTAIVRFDTPARVSADLR